MNQTIDFSIIIPTFRRHDSLRECLESISAIQYDRDRYEVIVVDDGSGHPPDEVVPDFKDRVNIRLLIEQHSGPASARNKGAACANGKFLVFIDDDCRLTPDWLSKIKGVMEYHQGSAVGGHTVNALRENVYSAASQTLIDYLYRYYNADHDRALFLTSNNVAFPAQKFREIGGFDTSFPLSAGEDRELCDRWRQTNNKITYAPHATVFHAHHLNFTRFLRQHFNYGRGARHYHQVRAARNSERVRLEPLSFYAGLIKFPFEQHRGLKGLAVSSLMLLSQVANAAGFFWAKRKLSRN